jgi:DNA-binding transcriptional regulator YbjK
MEADGRVDGRFRSQPGSLLKMAVAGTSRAKTRPASRSVRANSSNSSKSRRDLIAEAVISLLAREGGRGLTHGNIDRLLKLPKGSTSFYCRRRSDLFEAGLRKLVEEDLRDLNSVMASVFERRANPVGIRDVARCQHKLWQKATKPSQRNRVIARFEFFLHAARDSEFGQVHADVRKAIFDFGATMFARMGAKNPRRAAVEYGYLVRGDIMAYFLLPPSTGRHKITPAYYESQLEDIIQRTDRLAADTRSFPSREGALARTGSMPGEQNGARRLHRARLGHASE